MTRGKLWILCIIPKYAARKVRSALLMKRRRRNVLAQRETDVYRSTCFLTADQRRFHVIMTTNTFVLRSSWREITPLVWYPYCSEYFLVDVVVIVVIVVAVVFCSCYFLTFSCSSSLAHRPHTFQSSNSCIGGGKQIYRLSPTKTNVKPSFSGYRLTAIYLPQ